MRNWKEFEKDLHWKFEKECAKADEASCRVAYHLGVAGKPYSDGELVKRCLIDVVKCIHYGKEADYFSIALSRVTMQRWQDDIAQQSKLSLQAKINKKESLFPLAVDEATDINDSAQLLIFVCCLSWSFELCEDPFHGNTGYSHPWRRHIYYS